MSTIQLEIPDDLAEKLAPYRDQLLELLQLGLQERLAQEQQRQQARLWQVLRASGRVTSPKPYPSPQPYVRRTPLPSSGKLASELIIEQRGPL